MARHSELVAQGRGVNENIRGPAFSKLLENRLEQLQHTYRERLRDLVFENRVGLGHDVGRGQPEISEPASLISAAEGRRYGVSC